MAQFFKRLRSSGLSGSNECLRSLDDRHRLLSVISFIFLRLSCFLPGFVRHLPFPSVCTKQPPTSTHSDRRYGRPPAADLSATPAGLLACWPACRQRQLRCVGVSIVKCVKRLELFSSAATAFCAFVYVSHRTSSFATVKFIRFVISSKIFAVFDRRFHQEKLELCCFEQTA